MKPGTRIIDQVRRNFVAIVSLVVAVTSLGYNTWRNESSEFNRNQRLISVEVLRNLGELQQVVYHRHWGMDAEDAGNPLTGWAIVLTIDDLASILQVPVPESARALRDAWQQNSDKLGEQDKAEQMIIAAIDTVRRDVHALLSDLD
jgi:hypothetical protein